ncbi:MAG: tetratricopeptide repeat protein [Caldilineaceae bacterium]
MSFENPARPSTSTGQHRYQHPSHPSRPSCALHRKQLQAGHTANSLNNLGILAYYEGDKAAAHSYLQQALAIYTSRLGANHPDTQRTSASLAVVRAELDAGPPAPVVPTLTDRLRTTWQRLWQQR